MTMTAIQADYSDVSRPSQLSAHIYLRPLAQSRSSSSNDIYLGGIKVNPVFDEKVDLYPSQLITERLQ
jgi:hypothetical protein